MAHSVKKPVTPGSPSLSCTNSQAFQQATTDAGKDALLQQLAGELVAMLSNFPEGVELRQLRTAYRAVYARKLSLPRYGLKCLEHLLEALKDWLYVEHVNGKNFIKAKCHQLSTCLGSDGKGHGGIPTTIDRPSPRATEMDKTRRDVLDLLNLHPDGIPIKSLTNVFNQRYKRNLTVSGLGFQSVAQFVYALRDDVHVENEVLFHKSHRPSTSHVPLNQAAPSSSAASSLSACPTPSPLPLGAGSQHYLSNSSPGGVEAKLPLIMAGPQMLPLLTVMPARPGVQFCGGPVTFGTAEATVPAVCTAPTQRAASGGKLPDAPESMPKAESQKMKGSSMVFKDAYHRQLRELHSAQVRAVEALGEGGVPTGRRRGLPSMQEVNSRAEELIRAIATEGEHVTVDKVVTRLCRFFQVSSLSPIDPRRQLSAVMNLLRTIREVNMFMQAVEAVQSVCTLYELGQALASLSNKKHFEELNLGPLCKVPLVHKMFQVDSMTKDDDIPPIETVHILKNLRAFRRRYFKPKIDLTDFMKYLADEYDCDSPYKLGIRIQGLGLPISTLQKAALAERGLMDRAKEAIQKEIEEEVADKMRKIKRTLLDPAQGAVPFSTFGSSELRKKYASQTASEAVLAVFTNAEGVFSAKMTKHVREFLMRVSGDRLATALFQLAICCGSLEVPQNLVAKEKPSKQDIKQAEDEHSTPPPSEAAVKHFFQERLSSLKGALTLPFVSRLEREVTQHFKFKEFVQLKQGTFLEFLVKQTQVLQETGGSSLALSSKDNQACGFRASRQDVFEFIKQCGIEDKERLDSIEHALRCHYKVRDSRELGYGPLCTLVDMVQRQKDLSSDVREGPVRYESPLFVRDSRGGTVEAAHPLGDVSREQAVCCLLSAPLLVDLAEWSQWDLVFHAQHGPLKDFIEKNAATHSDLAALEVKPGLLLRITTSPSSVVFSEAAQALDPITTTGHLVSIVVADGISNAPVALLANHMESALAVCVAQEDTEDSNSASIVARFVLDCILRIPTRICKAVLSQVFLEPLSRVLGQARSKAVLLQTARSDVRYLNRLHHMGIVLGMTEWVKDFRSKMSPPQNKMLPPLIKKLRAVDSMSVSSGSSEVALSEDEDYILDSGPEPEQPSESSSMSSSDEDGLDDEDDEEKFELTPAQNGDMDAEILDGADGDVEEDQLKFNNVELKEEQMEDRLCSRRAVIEHIRKNEFGIGVELNEEGTQLMKVHQERLGRSLDRLSAELYSKDTHFVLELIQNADDNTYNRDAGVQPSLAFVVEKDCVAILNNESGFEEPNVRAICDVGRSTKGKHKYGYIGQKGIGFKSVFKVTHCPEIHSNDFHIRFDKNSSPMGYILPHWVEEERSMNTDMPELRNQSWTTKIFLPLQSESYQTRNLFHDIDPSLLLFLHRLRSITIINKIEGRVVSMTRRDLSHSVSEVQHTDGVERWLVVKRQLFPKKIKDDVESTELALAFRLNEDDSSSGGRFQPDKQPVFAFLPLRSFGFRFIVQGDFDIPSSREDVDRDSRWNQWLRSEIPNLFLHAMDVFTEHPEFSGLQGLCHFLQFVPLPDEILDFFNPVASQIIQLLKGKACLPTKEREDGAVEFKLPSQLAISQDPLIQEVIGEDLLHRHLNLSYLHPTLQSVLPPSLISALGVHRLRGSEISTVTHAMAKEIAHGTNTWSEPDLRTVARLLVCNFRALEQDYGEADSILQMLRDIPIIPLADGRMVALKDESVFFPLTDQKNAHTGVDALYKDLNTVSPRLLQCLDPLGNSLVFELLKRLDIHELEPQKVLDEHIYPTLRSGDWKRKPQDIVISYVVFMKHHSQGQDYRSLDTFIPVLTNRGFLCPKESKVQFSKEYGNIDLPARLPGVEWVLLDTCYLMADGDRSGWREFFIVLGVRDLLIFRKERLSMSAQELSCSLWATESEFCRTPEGLFVVEDYQCEEFHSLVSADQLSGQEKMEQRRELLNLLDKNWVTGENYSQYVRAQVLDSSGRRLRDTQSSFCYYLTHLAWVPALRRQPGEDNNTSVTYLRPSSVHLHSPDLFRLLGVHVNYIFDVSPSEFTNYVGMKHSMTVDDLVSHLRSWCTKSTDGECVEPERVEFTTTVEHVHSVYSFLYVNLNGPKVKKLFQEMPAVFIEYDRKEKWCSGKFYLLKELCWGDPTGMFRRYRQLVCESDSEVQEPRLLAPFYSSLSDMKDFFLQSLNVNRNPSMRQYVDLLELICASKPPTGDVLQDVSIIFAKLADICRGPQSGEQEHETLMDPSYCASLQEMLIDRKVFPTKSSTWVTLAHRPLIPDSKALEKLFRSHSSVRLLNLPLAVKTTKTKAAQGAQEKTFNETLRAKFLDICGLKSLSQCVTTEAQTENYRPCPPIQALVRRMVPYIQRYFYHHEDSTYWELKKSGIEQTMKALTFGQVGKLYIQYELNLPDSDPIFEREDVICLLKDNKELYIQKDHLNAKLDICRELVKLFSMDSNNPKDLEEFMHGLISKWDDKADLKRFLDREEVKELPSTEQKWEVPEPLEITPELPVPKFSQLPGVIEVERTVQQDNEETLACWPPKSSLYKNPGSHSVGGASAVEAVMKMWPPPAPPSSDDSKRTLGPSCCDNTEGPVTPAVQSHRQQQQNSRANTTQLTDKSHEAGTDICKSANAQPQQATVSSDMEAEPRLDKPEADITSQKPAEAEQHTVNSSAHLQRDDPSSETGVAPTAFKGNGFVQHTPLALNVPVWSKQLPLETVLEDLVLDCSRPNMVVFSDDKGDTEQIGQWGEQLVNSFLTHWRDSGSPRGPKEVTWYNSNGEGGQPYDFKVTFAKEGGGFYDVLVEVKATVRAEKHFIHLSANELDLALREKEKYHIYRVYNAGDSQSVRLCRIKNLAQHLHSKQLQLYLFV